MKKGRYNRILRTIASKESVSAEEVEMEMQAAIEDAFYRIDKAGRKKWSKISQNDGPPTVEEFVEYMEELVKIFRSSNKQ